MDLMRCTGACEDTTHVRMNGLCTFCRTRQSNQSPCRCCSEIHLALDMRLSLCGRCYGMHRRYRCPRSTATNQNGCSCGAYGFYS